MTLNEDQLLRLYDIETRNQHQQLDHILKIRGTMALAYTAIISAALISKSGLVALLGVFIFLGAWWWEYFYARYLVEHNERAGQLRLWIHDQMQDKKVLAAAYGPESGYDHRVEAVARLGRWVGNRLGNPRAQAFIEHFLDVPRALAYSAMAISLLIIAKLLQ